MSKTAKESKPSNADEADKKTSGFESVPRRVKSKAPRIPSIRCELLSNNSKSFIICPPNSRTPVPFETELFKGVAIIVLRTEPIDQQFAPFFAGKHLFEVQVQGKFKRMPVGEMYCGAEASKKMELGIITRSLSKATLTFCGTMVNDLHYSFGDPATQKDYQLPHLVAPFFASIGKAMVTPPGETPPQVGVPFNENPEYRKARFKFKTLEDCKINLENTYSFSVNTSQLDVVSWCLKGVPMVKPMDLRTFFADASIRLIAYEFPNQHLYPPNTHPYNALNYIFNMSLTPVMTDKPIDFDPSDDEDENDNGAQLKSEGVTTAESEGEVVGKDGRSNTIGGDDGGDEEIALEIARNKSTEILGIGDDDDDEDDDGPLSDNDYSKETKKRMDDPNDDEDDVKGNEKGKLRGWFVRQFSEIKQETQEVPEQSEYSIPDSRFEFEGDLRFCPACFDVSDHRKDMKRRFVYVMPWSETASTEIPTSANVGNFQARIKSYSEIAKAWTMVPIPKLHRNKRLTPEEKRRRQIAETYKTMLNRATANNGNTSQANLLPINTFLSVTTDLDKHFLSKPSEVQKSINSVGNKLERAEGIVACAKSNRHWTEMYMILTKTDLLCSKHAESRKYHIEIPLSTIVNVKAIPAAEAPIPYAFAFFQVETLSRVFYFMVRSEKLCTDWIAAFRSILGSEISNPSVHSSAIKSGMSYSEGDEVYLSKPGGWKLEKRRVYNYRRIFFRPEGIPDKFRNVQVNALIESILKKAFDLNKLTDETMLIGSKLWIDFLDEISLLQIMDLASLSERDRLVCFLNIYHTMILHGGVVLGLPIAWTNWQFFFNTVCYLLGGEIISIAEVEFNVLRAAMSKSLNLISKTFMVNAHFPQFALKTRDFRLNFCINNASVSMSQKIVIYRSDIIDRQLDEMTEIMINEFVEVDPQRRVIFLPKVCSSFLQDFIRRNNSGNGPNNNSSAYIDCVRALSSYLRGEDRHTIIRMLSFSPSPVIKFRKFQFSCRKYGLHEEEIVNYD